MPEEHDEELDSGSLGVQADNPTAGAAHKRAYKNRRRRRRKPQYFAAIDLGTNNCRLLVAKKQAGGFRVIDSYSKVVRLGAGLAKTGRLSDESMAAALKAIGDCAKKMKLRNVSRWRCIATQACRAAANGEDFLARVKRETGLAFETISPRVEARLSVMGCLNLMDLNKDVALVIDIGGGSTELSWVDLRKMRDNPGLKLSRPPIAAWVSLPIGVVNLSEMYPEEAMDNAEWVRAMKACVREEITKQNRNKQFTNLFEEGRGHMIGTSGTVTSLTSVLMALPFYQRNKIDGIWVNGAALMETAHRLGRMDLQTRQQEPCIGEDRASMIVAGCAIMEVVYELWPSEKIRVADRGLREGMLMGLMNTQQVGRARPRKTGSRPHDT